MNEALCFYDNIKILVVEKAVIFILSSELVFLSYYLSYLISLDRVLIRGNDNSFQRSQLIFDVSKIHINLFLKYKPNFKQYLRG